MDNTLQPYKKTLAYQIAKKTYAKIRTTYLIAKSYYKNPAPVYSRLYRMVAKDQRIAKTGAMPSLKELVIIRRLLRVPPAQTYSEVANFLLNCGQPEIAQTYFQESLKLDCIPATYSLYLQCLLLSPSCTEAEMFKVACKYHDKFLSSITANTHHTNEKTTNRILNVGYICHFFHNSVSLSMLMPLLKHHDRKRIKVFCYSDTTTNEVPAAVQSIPDVWRDTKDLTDVQLAQMIQADKIDVLLELNGHCVVNRYGVIAHKPAPVQVCYYNQCGTTGVKTIDYNLIGDEIILDKSQEYYSEAVYFIKGVTGAAEFSDTFPDPAPSPHLKNGYITFGSFGAAHKVNAEVVKLWCQVLKQLPTAKFYMKSGVLSHQNFYNVYKKLFEDNGIDSSRFILEGYSAHHVMLECYQNVDIALDTFPHGAGTTTFEALWQGVPVITLCGEKYAMQNGRSILNCIGHPELVAYTQTEYITKALQLAKDSQRLQNYRQILREDFRASPRGDVLGLSRKLDDAYHDMWQKYCDAHS